MEFEIELQWWLKQTGKRLPLDGNLITLLEAIKTTGSLQQAARDCEVSYRYAWGLMEKWQNIIGLALIEKQRGRGTCLAPAGHYLLQAHQHLQASLLPQLSNQATQLRQQLEELQTANNPARLRIYASHGLAVSALRDMLNQQQIAADLHFHGSLESLKALQKGECDIAGFHIPTGELGQQLAPDYLSMISPQTTRLIYLVRRQQGLMIAANNPHDVHDLHDLTRKDLRFINRQPGSGTRLLLDQLLHQQQINPDQINGYQQEEFTHMAVAAMVASGAADCGFGIAPVADRFALDFVPLHEEHYCLAIHRERIDDTRIQSIIDILTTTAWQQSQQAVRGYDLSHSGQLVSFTEIFGD